MPAIDPNLARILREYDCDPKADIWDCRGKWIAYHSTLERIAAKAKIGFDPPTVVEHDGGNGVVAIVVTGRMGDRVEWSFGEAAPKNNKNAYPYSMAEKRAKDRVTLKLIGAHGLVYSEEEAEDFKATTGNGVAPQPQPATEPDLTEQEALDALTADLGGVATLAGMDTWRKRPESVDRFAKLSPKLRAEFQHRMTTKREELSRAPGAAA